MLKKKIISWLLVSIIVLTVAPTQASATTVQIPSITASCAIVMDYDTGEIYYEKNADTAQPVASMTKIMTLYLVFEAIENGVMSLDTQIPISDAVASMSRKSTYSGLEYFPYNGTCDVETLISLAICVSGCASTMALAEYLGDGSEAAFVAVMNARMVEWGLDAQFADSHGWNDSGNAVSARAMATIAQRCIQDYPQILDYSSLTSVLYQGKTYSSSNTMLLDGICDGLKTGFTYGAGYCFTGTAECDGRRVIAVVMDSSSYTTRTTDATDLISYGFECQRTISMSGEMAYTYVQIRSGYSISIPVSVTCNEGISTTVPAAWYLDGEPIAGYSNSRFSVNPDGSSSYTFRATSDMEKGTYTLSFLIDPDSSNDGVEDLIVSTTIEII